ncbi:MAG: Maf family protein [Rhizobiales bacterium]|nr:Maf family protein [Hyphomicrobiales bacterium]
MPRLVLASRSEARASLLRGAAIDFEIAAADIDERAVEAPLLQGAFSPGDIAEILAEMKAQEVSRRHPGALVIGADQTMSYQENGSHIACHKAKDMDEARRTLLALSGRTHTLNAALCCVRDGLTLFRHADSAHLTMRSLSPAFIGHYLALADDEVLKSVGCYQLEGPGIQLFKRIEGDYFTILGLPLLPLLEFLRDEGMIEQ